MKKQAKLWVAAAAIAVAGGSASVAMAATTSAPSMVQKMATLTDKFHVQKLSGQTGQEGKGQFHIAIKGGPNAWQSNTELLTLLHLTSDELGQQLKDGKSLADIAAAQGVDKQQVIDLLVKEQVKQIDDGVAAGNLPSDKAAKVKEDLTAMVTDSVNGKQGAMMFRDHVGMGDEARAIPQVKGMIGGPDLADFLKITPEELKTELQSGKSLLDVATAHNVTKEQLVNFFTEQQTKQFDDALQAGHITQDQYNEMKSHSAEMINDMIEGKGNATFKMGIKRGSVMGDGAIAGPQMKVMIGGPDLADFLKITPEELKTELGSGKSLLDVATAHNVTKEQLVNFFTEQQTKKLDEALQAGQITQDQYNEMKSSHTEMINNMIEGKGPATFKMGIKQGADHEGQAQFKSNPKQVPQSESNAITKTVVKRQI